MLDEGGGEGTGDGIERKERKEEKKLFFRSREISTTFVSPREKGVGVGGESFS